MLNYVYKRCGLILAGKPFLLWGLSLLNGLLTVIALIFGVLPIISVPVVLTLEAGMTMIYLDGYKGNTVNSDQLFKGFKNFGHVAGGMAWRMLWTFLWSLISIGSILFVLGSLASATFAAFSYGLRSYMSGGYGIDSYSGLGGYNSYQTGTSALAILLCGILSIIAICGLVITIMKVYSYRFTPYILMERPEVSATEALRISMKETKGHKGTLFLADLICSLCIGALCLVNTLFSMIPFIGVVFGLVLGIVIFIVNILMPLFIGLVRAGLYVEITHMSASQPQHTAHHTAPVNPAPADGTPVNLTPVNHTPVTQTPANQVPVTQAPVDKNPADQAPVTQAPVDKNPADQTSANQAAPSDSLPTIGFCTACGTPIKQGQKFCTRCGKSA